MTANLSHFARKDCIRHSDRHDWTYLLTTFFSLGSSFKTDIKLLNNCLFTWNGGQLRVLREFSPEEVTSNIYTMVDVLLHHIHVELQRGHSLQVWLLAYSFYLYVRQWLLCLCKYFMQFYFFRTCYLKLVQTFLFLSWPMSCFLWIFYFLHLSTVTMIPMHCVLW